MKGVNVRPENVNGYWGNEKGKRRRRWLGGGEKKQRAMRVEANGGSTDGDRVEDTITYEKKM